MASSVSAFGCFLPSPRRSRSGTFGARGGGGSHIGTAWSGWGRDRSFGSAAAGGASADCSGYCAPGRPLAGRAAGLFGVGRLLGRPLHGGVCLILQLAPAVGADA